MARIDRKEHNKYMRQYYHKNRDRILSMRAERKLWKELTEADDRRARAMEALDNLLSDYTVEEVGLVLEIIQQCTPAMVEELVGKAKTLT